MPQVKKPYGLVYNTDGSLCVTYRDDDIPFQGVRSVAVEEATENLFTPPFDGVDGDWNLSATDPTGKFDTVFRANPNIYERFIYNNIQTTIDNSYSAQVWCYVSPDFDGTENVKIVGSAVSGYPGLSNLEARYDLSRKGTWQLLKDENVSATSSSSRIVLQITSFTTGYVLFARQQLEQKPFATSFVDGNRPAGRLRVGIDDLRDGRLYNHVLAFWFKVPPISTYELGNWPGRVGIVGNRVTPTYDGYSDYGICIESNGNLNFRVMKNPEGSSTLSFPQIPKEEYENRWNNVVIVFDEDDNLVRHYKIYFNGEYHGYADVTRMDNYARQAKPDTFYFYGTNLRSHLLSNIYIGKYRRPDGTVIWTDDYIREVYEAKMPFPVQSQLSIY